MSWEEIIAGIFCWELLKYIIVKWWYEIFKNQ